MSGYEPLNLYNGSAKSTDDAVSRPASAARLDVYYSLSYERVVRPNYTENKCVGETYKTLSDAIRAAHKYARRHLDSDYLFIHRKIDSVSVDDGDFITLACSFYGDEIRKIILQINNDDDE